MIALLLLLLRALLWLALLPFRLLFYLVRAIVRAARGKSGQEEPHGDLPHLRQ